jgi:hypothetical protein
MLPPRLWEHASVRRLSLLWILVASIGLVLLLVPEPQRYPLISSDGWEVTTGFIRTSTPAGNELSSEILGNKDTIYWRSVIPRTGSGLGRLVSKPFALPEYISVPYIGYAGNPDTAIYLQCAATGKRIRVATANTHELWTEDILRIPNSWCPSEGRLEVESHSKSTYIGAATPFGASFISWIRESLFTVVFIHAFLFAVLALTGLVIALPLQLWIGGDEYFPLLVMAGSTAAGYVAFFVFDADSRLGQVWSWLVVSASIATLMSRRRRRELRRLFHQFTEVSWPVICLFLISLGYVTLLYSVGNGTGSFAATYRYAPAIWSTDNQLAQMIAEQMVTGPHRSFLQVFGPAVWKISDRPPGLIGIFLLARPVFGVLLPFGENRHLAYYFYQIGGVIVMSCWILPFWVLCRKLRLSVKRSVLATALVATSGFALFNSTYIWPKMNAAALGLGAYLLLVAEPYATGIKPPLKRVCLAGGLAALAMLCHGGVVFGLAGLGAVLCWPRLWPGWKPSLAAFVVFVALLLPWTIWQRTVNPPGNALIKYALAGTFGFGEDSVSVLDTVKRTYQRLTFQAWLGAKFQAVETVWGRSVVYPDWVTRYVAVDPGPEITGRLRSREFYFIVPSLGILNAGWLLGLIVWIRKRAQPAQHSEEMPEGLKPLLFVGITGVLLNVLLTWDFHVVHHNSYLSMLALLGGLAILVSGAPGRWRVLLAGIQFVYFLVIWVASPLATANRINVGLLIGCLTIVASFWYLSGLVSSEASARFDGASLAGRAKPVSERHLKTAQRRTRSRH